MNRTGCVVACIAFAFVVGALTSCSPSARPPRPTITVTATDTLIAPTPMRSLQLPDVHATETDVSSTSVVLPGGPRNVVIQVGSVSQTFGYLAGIQTDCLAGELHVSNMSNSLITGIDAAIGVSYDVPMGRGNPAGRYQTNGEGTWESDLSPVIKPKTQVILRGEFCVFAAAIAFVPDSYTRARVTFTDHARVSSYVLG